MQRRLNKIIPVLVFPLLLQATSAHAESCAETLKQVETLYNKTVSSCGEDPASDCSGLLKDPGMSTQNGYLITLVDLVRKPETPVHVYCAFPNDAWTDFRDDRGCGNNRNTTQTEAVCQAMNPPMSSANAWVAHFTRFNNDRKQDQLQCGFNMRNPMSSKERVDTFKNFMGARQVINTREFQTQTELRLGNPKEDELPILAFF